MRPEHSRGKSAKRRAVGNLPSIERLSALRFDPRASADICW